MSFATFRVAFFELPRRGVEKLVTQSDLADTYAELGLPVCCLAFVVSDKALADREEARPSGLIHSSPSRAYPVSFTSPGDTCPAGAWCSQVRSRCGVLRNVSTPSRGRFGGLPWWGLFGGTP